MLRISKKENVLKRVRVAACFTNIQRRVKILQLAETWPRYNSLRTLARKNGIACRAEDKLTVLVPGGNAPGLISRFGIEWTVSLSSPRTITIVTRRC